MKPLDIDWDELLLQIRQQLGGRIPRVDIDDVAQDVAVTLLENVDRFDPEKSNLSSQEFSSEKSLRAWVSGITGFKRIEYFAKRRREKQLLEEFVEQAHDKLDEGNLPQSLRLEMGETLEPMMETLRECSPALLEVAGPYFEGKNAEEIASELGISLDAVYQRLSRLRKKMKTKVDSLPSSDSMSELVFSSSRSFFDTLHKCVRQQTLQGKWDGESSLEHFNRLVDGLEHLEDSTREKLKRARHAIDHGKDALSDDDKIYVNNQLIELAEELQTSKPQSESVKKLSKLIKPAAPNVFAILSKLE